MTSYLKLATISAALISVGAHAEETVSMYGALGCTAKVYSQRIIANGYQCDNTHPGKPDNSKSCKIAEENTQGLIKDYCQEQLSGQYKVLTRDGDYIKVKSNGKTVWSYSPK